jgi:hypothetical protein
MPALFRRRQVWWPTLWGSLLLLGGAALLLGLMALRVGDFLMLRDPARGPDGQGARTLVVEGWLDENDLEQALAAFRRGRYERVLTTGGPIDSWDDSRVGGTFAARAAGYLKARGLASVPVLALPAPASAQNRTFLSAVMVREWAQHTGIRLDAVDLYSSGIHARRSRLLYRLALGPDIEVGVLAANPRTYDAERWWNSSDGAKTLVGELLGLAWTKCCFWPPPPGSHEERWGVPKSPA